MNYSSTFRRAFSAGEIVSYLSGQRTFTRLMFHDNMTLEEEWVTSDYFFNLGYHSPVWWNYSQVTIWSSYLLFDLEWVDLLN